ncbi:unnamed protein product [Pleuronectes platessa]|uniref:Uncharacterized protein n=1 Tax=Pleuronectes platessa TaxID=8262 RepID=A0A9N7VJ13_PLEPL|nr:unnamed protein product [Pleuronectes platessa]
MGFGFLFEEEPMAVWCRLRVSCNAPMVTSAGRELQLRSSPRRCDFKPKRSHCGSLINADCQGTQPSLSPRGQCWMMREVISGPNKSKAANLFICLKPGNQSNVARGERIERDGEETAAFEAMTEKVFPLLFHSFS